MGKRVITFDLSPSGIDHALEEIEKFKNDLIKACNELIKLLTSHGIEAAAMVIEATTEGWTGQLLQSIYQGSGWKAQTRTGIVRADAPYAAFVEFGTGIKGKAGAIESPFPHDGYEPDGMGHGLAGWWYYNPNDDKVHWTQGQQSKPYMYTAFARVRSDTPSVVATVFAKI